jgi:uncharacterized cupin superfamily protein
MQFTIGNGNFQRCTERTKSSGASSGDFFLIRHGSGLSQNLMDGTLKIEGLTGGADFGSGFDAVVVTAKPGVSCWEGKVSDGDKWYFILEGSLEIIVDSVARTLSEGDSIYLESSDSHIWRNPNEKTARALVLSTSDSKAEAIY